MMTKRAPERWLPVVEYESSYEVSSHGRVRSIDRIEPNTGRRLRGKILRQATTTYGYLAVSLSRHGTGRYIKVHRLVATTFLGLPSSCEEVNHKNGVKKDNELTNLEFVTSSENKRHAFAMGLYKHIKGSDMPWSKLTENQIPWVRRRLSLGDHPRDIAQVLGVCKGTIYEIRAGRSWAHVR